jgi:hypothetical protein
MKQIFILVSLVLFSCASRKVNKEVTQKDSLKQIETKIVTKEETNIAIKNDILIDEFTITPLDSLKDIVINGISYKNIVLRYKKVKDNSLHIEKKIVSKNEHKKETIKTLVKSFKKQIDKKANYFIYLWLLLIPLFFLIRHQIIKRLLI